MKINRIFLTRTVNPFAAEHCILLEMQFQNTHIPNSNSTLQSHVTLRLTHCIKMNLFLLDVISTYVTKHRKKCIKKNMVLQKW